MRKAGSVARLRLHQLDGDLATEPGVGADVDVGHAAATDQVADLVPVGEEVDPLSHAFSHACSPNDATPVGDGRSQCTGAGVPGLGIGPRPLRMIVRPS